MNDYKQNYTDCKRNPGGNRFLAVGIVIALILPGIASIYAVRVLDKKLNSQNREIYKNPLLNTQCEEADNGKPDIPGITVYHAEEDIDRIKLDAHDRETQFRKNLEESEKGSEAEKENELLIKRNEFAARRLEFLKKIKAAKTKEERAKLIDELKKFCEGNQ
jgi:hypothetical protein